MLSSRWLPKSLPFQTIKYAEWLIRIIFAYVRKNLAVIHCHDLEPLPIAVVLKWLTGAKLIYDAHEFETETLGKRGIRKKLAQVAEKILIGFADDVITVSPSIKDWYQKKYGVAVSLLRNIPDISVKNKPVINLKDKLGISEDSQLFLYLGNLSNGRGIANILDSFSSRDVNHHVLFMGKGLLLDKVIKASQEHQNIHHLEPVPPSEVLSYARGADVGLCLYEDTCLNYRYCLPNKLFESILAGIPVLSSNLPDQADVVKTYKAGWIVDNDVESIKAFLVDIQANDIDLTRKGLPQRASDLSWHNESQTLLAIYQRLKDAS